MKYRVMVIKYGYATVEADTEEDARKKTNEMREGEFDWTERDSEDSEIVEDYVHELWEEFGDVPMNPETEEIEEEWNGFPPGTHREEIWHWFEESFCLSVAEDLMGQRYIFDEVK